MITPLFHGSDLPLQDPTNTAMWRLKRKHAKLADSTQTICLWFFSTEGKLSPCHYHSRHCFL